MPPPTPLSPPALFGRPHGCIDQLSEVERASIITLHKIGWLDKDIAQVIKCNKNTVSLWIARWEEEHSVKEKERSGRPRCTDDATDVAIQEYAEERKATVPKENQRALDLACSLDTIRRRLHEVGLYGRVARETHAWTEFDVKRRLAFAEGYRHWTEEDWERVIFCDETHIELTPHGQVWVHVLLEQPWIQTTPTRRSDWRRGFHFRDASVQRRLDKQRYSLVNSMQCVTRIFFLTTFFQLLMPFSPLDIGGCCMTMSVNTSLTWFKTGSSHMELHALTFLLILLVLTLLRICGQT